MNAALYCVNHRECFVLTLGALSVTGQVALRANAPC